MSGHLNLLRLDKTPLYLDIISQGVQPFEIVPAGGLHLFNTPVVFNGIFGEEPHETAIIEGFIGSAIVLEKVLNPIEEAVSAGDGSVMEGRT